MKNHLIRESKILHSELHINQSEWLREQLQHEIGNRFTLSKFKAALIGLGISYASQDALQEISLFDRKGDAIWHSNPEINLLIQKTQENQNNKKGDDSPAPPVELAELNRQFESQLNFTGVSPQRKSANTENGYLVYLHFDNEDLYLFWQRTYQPFDSTRLGIILFFASLFSSLILALFIRQIYSVILTPLQQMKESIGSFLTDRNRISVDYFKNNELGELVKNYNELLSFLDKNGCFELDNQNENAVLQTDEHALAMIQKKLYEKPFPQLDSAEVAVYPRRPDINQQDFLSAGEMNGKPVLALLHFDITSIETGIVKHRLQEEFFTLISSGHSFSDIAKAMWENMFTHIDYGPGICMAYIDVSSNTMQVLKSGDFACVNIAADGSAQIMENGSFIFHSDYPGLEQVSIEETSYLAMLSHEMIFSLQMLPAEFVQNELQATNTNLSGKQYLQMLLEKISRHSENPDVMPGMATLVRLKR